VPDVLTLLGFVLVLTGAILGIIGTLGAIGASLQLSVLPGREVHPVNELARISGRAVVHGRAQPGPGGVYAAPLSGTPCVWYLVSQSVVRGDDRQTEDRFAPEPFVIDDGTGRVLVGPRCPALEQIAPSYRSDIPHPAFGSAETDAADAVEVYEFVIAAEAPVTASGEVHLDTEDRPRVAGDVVLSEDVTAAAGDPARYKLRRDITLALGGMVLAFLGALAL
jgi:hypothetical protein